MNTKELQEILNQARTGDMQKTLRSLLVLWAELPLKELGDLIVRVGMEAGRGRALLAKKVSSAETWLRVAGKQDPADLDRLLASLTEGRSKQALERFETIAAWPPDPRMDRYLITLLREVPYQSNPSQKFWRRIFKRVMQFKDPRLLPELKLLSAYYEKNLSTTLAELMQKKTELALKELIPELTRTGAMTPPLELASFLEKLEGMLPQDGRKQEESRALLLEQIFASPENDETRLVYADQLLEAGDPRGEFIILQYQKLKGDFSKEQARREKQLFNENWKTFLGPLARLVQQKGLVFERGFISACITRDSLVHVREAVGNPLWSTVEQFEGSREIYWHPVMKSLRSLVVDRDHENIFKFCERKIPWQLEHVDIRLDNTRESQALANAVSLPKLQSLFLRKGWRYNGDYKTILQGKFAENLRHVRLKVDANQIQTWQNWINANQTSIETFELCEGYYDETPYLILRFLRDKKGAFSRASLEMLYGSDEYGVRALENLNPKTLTELKIIPETYRGKAQNFAELNQAARKFSDLEKLVLP